MCMVTVQWLNIFCIPKFGQTGLEMPSIVKITSTLKSVSTIHLHAVRGTIMEKQ